MNAMFRAPIGTYVCEQDPNHTISYSHIAEDCVDSKSVGRVALCINAMRFADETNQRHDKYNIHEMNNLCESRHTNTALMHNMIADYNDLTSQEHRVATAIAASQQIGQDIEIPYVDYVKIERFFNTKIFALLHRSVTTHETLTLGELAYSLMNAPKFSTAERQIVRALCQHEIGNFLREYAVEITSVRGDNIDNMSHVMEDTCTLLKSRILAQRPNIASSSSSRMNSESSWAVNRSKVCTFPQRIVFPTIVKVDYWAARVRPATRGAMHTVQGETIRQLIRRAKLHDRSLGREIEVSKEYDLYPRYHNKSDYV